jgi:hypothetical protein
MIVAHPPAAISAKVLDQVIVTGIAFGFKERE